MYRESDEDCEEKDAEKIEKFRENWEVLSQEATDLIGDLLEPRLAFSGHSHDYCRVKNRLKIEEYTIPSFSWRNRDNPAFSLVIQGFCFYGKVFLIIEIKSFQATFTEKDYSVTMCDMPRESTVIWTYIWGVALSFLNSIRISRRRR